MAERRMFAKTIIDSDFFLDMPLSTQSLYFHLSMRADDDGFVNNPKKIMRMIGASSNEFDILVSKRFLILFDTGVVVIKHWKLHNYIQKDRYKETVYREEKELLLTKDNKTYTLKKDNVYMLDTECEQDGYSGKVREELEIGKSKDNKEKNNKKENYQPFDTYHPENQKQEDQVKTHTDILRDRIKEIKQHWKSLSVLPQTKALDTNQNHSHALLDAMNVFPNKDIIQAMNNLATAYPSIDAKYRIKSFSNFMTPENIEKWYPEQSVEAAEKEEQPIYKKGSIKWN